MRRIVITFLALVMVIVLYIGINVVVRVIKKTNDANEDSARRALFVEVTRALAGYHKTHNQYPSSLQNLVITNFPDGSSKKTILLFTYKSDGKSYELSCPLLWNQELLVEHSN
jgi:hypothetical protein